MSPASTPAELRHELALERERLVHAVDALRESAAPSAVVRGRLPLVLVGAFVTGFVLTGGIGATARLYFRRRREGRARARLGSFTLVER